MQRRTRFPLSPSDASTVLPKPEERRGFGWFLNRFRAEKPRGLTEPFGRNTFYWGVNFGSGPAKGRAPQRLHNPRADPFTFPMKQRYSPSTWAILAGLRFVLAAIVMLAHLHVFVPQPFAFGWVSALGAKAAVLAFLLISGVSIGNSYSLAPNGFLKRRFLRIYPLYFFAVVLAHVLTLTVGSPYQVPGQVLVAAGWKTDLANVFFLQDFFAIPIPYNGPLWSLSVEVFLAVV